MISLIVHGEVERPKLAIMSSLQIGRRFGFSAYLLLVLLCVLFSDPDKNGLHLIVLLDNLFFFFQR